MGPDVGSNLNRVCPLPRFWYPQDSPCAHTDEFHLGQNDPAFSEADRQRLSEAGGSLSFWFNVAVGLVVVYLAIRAMEAVAALRRS